MKFGRFCFAFYVALTDRVVPTVAVETRVRIINGTSVKQSSPYHAMFALPTNGAASDEWLGCGASIISPTFALTSAHCFGGGASPCSGPQSIALWIGDIQLGQKGLTTMVSAKNQGRSFRVEADLMCNPAFDGKCSHGNDVALLKLRKKLPGWVKPVTLDLDGMAASKVGDMVTPMGFGMVEDAMAPTAVSYDNSPLLRSADVTVLAQNSEHCGQVYAGGYGCSDDASIGAATNLDMQLCAGTMSGIDQDACAGDSGSPVVDKSGVQVGLVSYGGGPGEKMSGPGRMCGDPNYPGVYVRVSAFRDFLTQKIPDLPGNHQFISFADDSSPYTIFRPIAAHLRR